MQVIPADFPGAGRRRVTESHGSWRTGTLPRTHVYECYEQVSEIAKIIPIASAGSKFAPTMTMACPIALVAEDDAELRDLLGTALSSAGFDVRKARDGLELLANTALPETLPDLIITDVDMPRCNGLSALGAVHRFAPQIPSIVMTAFADEATCAEARRFGAQLVIDKPFDVVSLCSIAREIVANRDTIPAIGGER